ncbi:MAG: polyisoprenoid-binding protein [Desulfobacterales bacterium]|nr:MAG: polyisoprenoid-binding protein [Desulfobacterales bacterium]
MKRILLIVLTLMLLGHTQVMAHEWKIDSVHSGVLFEIKHIYSMVRGHFSDFNGEVYFDPDNLEKSKFDLVVKVNSINTNNGKRDNHLRSDDFFAESKYPVMTFKSSRVSHAGGNKYTLEGKMTIKDTIKDMVLEFIYWGQKENPFKKSKMVAGFDSRFTINRLDYHVGDGQFYNMGVVGKDVDILITLEVIRNK